MTGEYLFVNRIYGPTTPQIIPFLNITLPYFTFPGFKDPANGDVIVFVWPGERDEVEANIFNYYLKRCIGIPGDTIEIKNRVLFVNGVQQQYPAGTTLYPVDFNDSLYQLRMQYESFYNFPKTRGYTTHNWGPLRVPKKGDTIQLNNRNDFEDWRIFIEREGHSIFWANRSVIDNISADYYIVEKDYYFAMGDNRDNSSDSRTWGFVPRERILGSPLLCWMSWELNDENGQPRNFFDKLANIRWKRIGRTIS